MKVAQLFDQINLIKDAYSEKQLLLEGERQQNKETKDMIELSEAGIQETVQRMSKLLKDQSALEPQLLTAESLMNQEDKTCSLILESLVAVQAERQRLQQMREEKRYMSSQYILHLQKRIFDGVK